MAVNPLSLDEFVGSLEHLPRYHKINIFEACVNILNFFVLNH